MIASSPIRIGLIGAGYIASWHADALKATPGVEITAVCDRSQGAAEGLAAVHGAQVFTSVADLIAAQACDAVHILTPPNLHHDLAIECLEGGLDVLVEKPVALSAAETQSISDTAARVGKRFSPGHNFLGLPRYEALKAMVTDGQLGRIAEARINLLKSRAKTTARVSRGDLSDGDFSLSPMSSEIAAQDRISETTLPIGPKSVPDWSRAMWAEATVEA